MTYNFEPYDVLQSRQGWFSPWQDFSTLRTEYDAELATRLVDSGEWEGKPMQFRIVSRFPFAIKYAQTRNPTETDNVTRGRIQES